MPSTWVCVIALPGHHEMSNGAVVAGASELASGAPVLPESPPVPVVPESPPAPASPPPVLVPPSGPVELLLSPPLAPSLVEAPPSEPAPVLPSAPGPVAPSDPPSSDAAITSCVVGDVAQARPVRPARGTAASVSAAHGRAWLQRDMVSWNTQAQGDFSPLVAPRSRTTIRIAGHRPGRWTFQRPGPHTHVRRAARLGAASVHEQRHRRDP